MRKRVNRLCLELNVVGRKRPTKYFFNLEKRNYNKKTISELRLQDESTTNNENVILDQIEIFIKIYIHQKETFR